MDHISLLFHHVGSERKERREKLNCSVVGIFVADNKKEYRSGPHEYLGKSSSVHDVQLEVRWARVPRSRSWMTCSR
jgi:hypothetical protein